MYQFCWASVNLYLTWLWQQYIYYFYAYNKQLLDISTNSILGITPLLKKKKQKKNRQKRCNLKRFEINMITQFKRRRTWQNIEENINCVKQPGSLASWWMIACGMTTISSSMQYIPLMLVAVAILNIEWYY